MCLFTSCKHDKLSSFPTFIHAIVHRWKVECKFLLENPDLLLLVAFSDALAYAFSSTDLMYKLLLINKYIHFW